MNRRKPAKGLEVRLSKVYKSSEVNEAKLKKYIDERYFRSSKKCS